MITIQCTSREGCNLIQFANNDTNLKSFIRDMNELELSMFAIRVIDTDISDDSMATYLHSIISSTKGVLTISQMHHIKILNDQLDSTNMLALMKTNILLREIYLFDIANRKHIFNN